MSAIVRLRCRKHPHYQAKRTPRSECRTCWYLYDLVATVFRKVDNNLLVERAGK
jgi:hypothetical protein